MNTITFLNPTLSSLESDRTAGSELRDSIQALPSSRQFKSVWTHRESSNPKKTVLLKKSDTKARDIIKNSTQANKNHFKDFLKRKITIKPKESDAKHKACSGDSTPFESSTQMESSTNHQADTQTAKPPLNINESLHQLNGSLLRQIRNQSMPNIKMLEQIRHSARLAAPQGDCEPLERSGKKSKIPSANFADFKQRMSFRSLSERKEKLSYDSQTVGGRHDPYMHSVSLRLTVKVSETSNKNTISIEQKNKMSQDNGLYRIDTNIDIEKMLMENPDFVRYVEENRENVPRISFNTLSPELRKSKPVNLQHRRMMAFGSPLKYLNP